VQRKDSNIPGPRTEIKNIGSVRGVANAIASEISRQLSLVQSGKRIISETRSYDANSKSTVPMRDKEEKQVKYSNK
jgi:aspartyl-tRNA(Asn)/glutamyl-tRNA(Gln) amidotransferase subunit B